MTGSAFHATDIVTGYLSVRVRSNSGWGRSGTLATTMKVRTKVVGAVISTGTLGVHGFLALENKVGIRIL